MNRNRDRSRDRDRDHDRDRDRDRGGDRDRRDHHQSAYEKRQHQQHKPEPKYEYGKIKKEDEPKEPVVEKEKPSLALSGNLAKDTNTYNGVVIKYNEPPEARKPIKRWRLYCFKGEEELPFYPIHRQSAYLFGRDRLVADIPVEHPSCSKQHAVFQYRIVEYKRKDGSTGRTIKPYIIDLGSTNGTFVNNNQIEAQRYFELREKDLIKFGFSSREYVLLHEGSRGNLSSDEDNEESVAGGAEAELVEVKKEKEDDEEKPKSSKSKRKEESSSSESESGSDSDDDDRKKKHKKSHK